jgi:hypothetical protein
MPKKQVLIECIVNVRLVGPDLAKGEARIYRDLPTTAEYKNPKNSGGEIWDWATSNWDEFIPDEVSFEIGGAEVVGKPYWICVTGVMDAKTKKRLPVLDTKPTWQGKKKKKTSTKKARPSAPSGQKAAPSKAKTQDKPAQSSKYSGLVDQADVDSVISDKIQKAMAEEA